LEASVRLPPNIIHSLNTLKTYTNIGIIVEMIGYIGRIISTKDIWALGPFIMQSILLLVAPALFAASIYIILGRIILLTDGEKHSLIRQKWLTKIFVAGDVISFLVQSGGGGIQSMGTLSSMHTGENLIIVGLFLQLAFFGFFVVVAGIFHWRLVKANPPNSRPTHASGSLETSASLRGLTSKTEASSEPAQVSYSQQGLNINDLPWKRHLYALYSSSALILVRSLFRVIEYLQGNGGYLLRHEVFLYVFDATLMLGVMVLFNWIHPSEVTEAYERRKGEGRGEELREEYLRND
jgi:hypothetical protein